MQAHVFAVQVLNLLMQQLSYFLGVSAGGAGAVQPLMPASHISFQEIHLSLKVLNLHTNALE